MSSTPEKEILYEEGLDQTLRPTLWEEYIGQKATKDNLKILLSAAKERGHAPEHLLFYGPPGLGKTTLAYLIAKDVGANLKTTSGPAIERIGDLASILTNLESGDILFIDEIHRLQKAVEEILYPAMESRSIDIIIGKGPAARSIQLELPAFTLIAATTRMSLLSSPLRSRFSGGTFRLEYYSKDEIAEIVRRSAHILDIHPSEDAISAIAARSRFTPRTANYLLKRCRDLAQIERTKFDTDSVTRTFSMLGIDELGLTGADRALLSAIAEKFRGGPVGVSTLAAALSEEISTIEEVYEPYLIQLGLLERTPRGRTLTPLGYQHISHDKTSGLV